MSYSALTHLHYNLWANQRLIEIIRPLDNRFLFTQLKSSFPGVGKTLLHIWDAEVIWFKRLQGESLMHLPSKDFQGNKDDLMDGLISSSGNFVSLAEQKGPGFLSETIAYKNTRGDAFEDGVANILFHVVNHGTYHRGQIITMLREMEIVHVVNTDLINYLRTIK